MSVVIGTNVPALLAAHHLSTSRKELTQSMTRLASGQRINSAADDAGGVGVAANLLAAVKGARMAKQNASNALAAVELADSAMSEVGNMLQRVRELVVQLGSTNVYSSTDEANMGSEITQLMAEVGEITSNLKFNGVSLSAATLTVAARQDGSTTVFTLPTFLAGSEVTSASTVANVDTAINSVAAHRGSLGAYINRLESTVNSLSGIAANNEAAYSRVMDTDYAYESAQVAKGQILQQAGAAILAQANASTQYVLTILQ